MGQTAEFLLAIGSLLLLGLATDFIGKHSFLARVNLLLLLPILRAITNILSMKSKI